MARCSRRKEISSKNSPVSGCLVNQWKCCSGLAGRSAGGDAAVWVGCPCSALPGSQEQSLLSDWHFPPCEWGKLRWGKHWGDKESALFDLLRPSGLFICPRRSKRGGLWNGPFCRSHSHFSVQRALELLQAQEEGNSQILQSLKGQVLWEILEWAEVSETKSVVMLRAFPKSSEACGNFGVL